MKVVFSSPNFLLVAHGRGLLETAGIPCSIRNEYLGSAAGELPPVECWPQLCVEARWERDALAVLREAREAAPPAAGWTCGGCGERLEGQFTACWNCGRERG